MVKIINRANCKTFTSRGNDGAFPSSLELKSGAMRFRMAQSFASTSIIIELLF